MLVVVGATRTGSGIAAPLSRWTAVRLARSCAAPVDGGFGQQGRATVPACDNRAGNGPSGVTVTGTRILVLGSCGESGSVAVARLVAINALPTGARLTIEPAAEAAGRRRVPLAGVGPTRILGAVDALQAAALRNSALRNSGLRNSALRNSALRNSKLASTPVRQIAVQIIATVRTRRAPMMSAGAGLRL